ncbi:hypothetical protein [Nocardia terpenica]|uniref:Uncharacterized protein n=1 Tax=Nocardia terpenica TaxID=455432 RepID=A0A164JVU1_9NOCA|nr:hypothetical protein [Nocardia terpenica]KZM70770.1 hypothetical protein AWN90_40145 [Nocardia terpenica]NQE89963.1 hypothetical protein [Nocardia terpenica]
MSECRNRRCARPCAEFLCASCAEELAAALDGVPWLLDELAVTELRQDRVSRGLRSGSRPVAPLPFHPAAAELHATLTNGITTWARHLAESRGIAGPVGDGSDAARWLADNIMAVRLDEAAGQIHAEITHAVHAALVVINPPPQLVYRGPCPTIIGQASSHRPRECERPLYAEAGELFVNCPACGVRHDVVRLEQQLLARIGGRMFEIPDLVRVLRELGEPVPRGTIVSWVHRGQLRAVAHSAAGKPLYRLDDARKRRTNPTPASRSR